MIQAAKIIGTGLATTGLIGAGSDLGLKLKQSSIVMINFVSQDIATITNAVFKYLAKWLFNFKKTLKSFLLSRAVMTAFTLTLATGYPSWVISIIVAVCIFIWKCGEYLMELQILHIKLSVTKLLNNYKKEARRILLEKCTSLVLGVILVICFNLALSYFFNDLLSIPLWAALFAFDLDGSFTPEKGNSEDGLLDFGFLNVIDSYYVLAGNGDSPSGGDNTNPNGGTEPTGGPGGPGGPGNNPHPVPAPHTNESEQQDSDPGLASDNGTSNSDSDTDSNASLESDESGSETISDTASQAEYRRHDHHYHRGNDTATMWFQYQHFDPDLGFDHQWLHNTICHMTDAELAEFKEEMTQFIHDQAFTQNLNSEWRVECVVTSFLGAFEYAERLDCDTCQPASGMAHNQPNMILGHFISATNPVVASHPITSPSSEMASIQPAQEDNESSDSEQSEASVSITERVEMQTAQREARQVSREASENEEQVYQQQPSSPKRKRG